MCIAFCWDWTNEAKYLVHWRDGLAGAVKELMRRGHHVTVFTEGKYSTVIPTDYFDVRVESTEGGRMIEAVKATLPEAIIVWADMTRPNTDGLRSIGVPMVICFAGGATDAEHWYKFDHIFVENDEYKEKFEAQGAPSVSVAFGTNTEHFAPIAEAKKNFDVYFPATFADWKRHDLLTKAIRGRFSAICTGVMYEEREDYCWKVPMQAGITVAPYVSAEVTRFLMAQSRCVVIPSKNIGGSQRTVLEALAMNVPCIVMADNVKCCEYLRQAGLDNWIVEPEPDAVREKIVKVIDGWHDYGHTRPFIEKNWSHIVYADRIEQKLVELCTFQ